MKKTRYRVSLRLTALLSALIVLLTLLPIHAADGNGMNVNLGNAACRKGEAVVIPVSVENNPGISALGMSLVYDDTKLEFLDVGYADFYGSIEVGEKILWMNNSDVHGDGVVLQLVFRALVDPDPSLSVTVAFDDGDIVNSREEKIGVGEIGTATVSLGSCEHELEIFYGALPGCVYNGYTDGEYCTKCDVFTVFPTAVPPIGHCYIDGKCAYCGLEIDGVPTLTLTSGFAGKGDKLIVNVYIVNSPGISAMSMLPVYDKSLFELKSVKFNSNGFNGISEYVSKLVSVTNHDVSGTFLYATLIFNVISDDFVRSEITMNTNSNSFVNASEERVEFQVEPATVVHNCVDGHHVYIDVPGVKPTCTEPGYTAGSYCVYCYQPEVASTEIPALGHTYVDGFCKNCGEKCPFIMGDTNADGTIDVKDIIRLMKYIAGVDIEIQGADVNGDGAIDTLDIVRLMKLIAES